MEGTHVRREISNSKISAIECNLNYIWITNWHRAVSSSSLDGIDKDWLGWSWSMRNRQNVKWWQSELRFQVKDEDDEEDEKVSDLRIYIYWALTNCLSIEVVLKAPCILLFSHFCDITRIKLFHEEKHFLNNILTQPNMQFNYPANKRFNKPMDLITSSCDP